MMTDGIITVAVIGLVFAVLLWRRGIPTDVAFVGGLMLVTLCQVITPKEALRGFVNPAVVTIGALYVMAAGLKATGVLDLIGHHLLGTARDERSALFRLVVPVAGLSALINNTPIVAMTVPTVLEWCRRIHVSPSRLLIPVSYLAILGGSCTLIGTSTNLVVNGLMLESPGMKGMGFFEIGYVGLPCAVVGIIYIALVGRRLLPNRLDMLESLDDQRRDYLVEMLVQKECRLAGMTVEQAGLRNLPGLFLIEIDRQGDVITPVTPQDVIQAGDCLVFTGIVSTIVDLKRIPGLVPAVDSSYVPDSSLSARRHLTEVVLSNTSPLIGSTVKEAKFRQIYNAAVVAVHRNGIRVTNKVGSISLEAGDTLLLQTRDEFIDNYRHSRDFYLVSSVEGSQPRRYDKVGIALFLLVLLVVLMTLGTWLTRAKVLEEGMTAIIALSVAGLMVGTRCLPVGAARGAIELQVLLTIGAALGLGTALEKSGATATMATAISNMAAWIGPDNPYVLLALVYLMTLLLTELITNTAVAALMFPLAHHVAFAGPYDVRPFVMAIALAASCSFITPIGYQTNLMVMGPGGYRPIDYVRVGLPLTVLVMVTAMLLIPLVWPF